MRLSKSIVVVFALACVVGWPGDAAAQSKENLRKLSSIYKLIQDDETTEALKQLNALLEDAPEDPDTAAKAMLLRGQVHAKSDRHANALADFDAALWLQGLNDSQRKDAVAGRKAALSALGLADESDSADATDGAASSGNESIPTSIPTSTAPEPAAPATSNAPTPAPQPTASSEPTPARDPAAGAWQTDVESAGTQPEESGGIGSFFSNLFGGSNEPDAPDPEGTETATAASGWSASTDDTSQALTSSSADAGRYRVQIASVGTRDGAESEVRRLSRLLGDALQGQTPRVVRTDTDEGNTYYRIVVGPKPSRDAANALCQNFKSEGVDCLVVSSR